MTGLFGCGVRRTAGLVGAVVVLVLIAAPAASAATPSQDIHSSGPLSDIWIGNELSCQVAHTGNSASEFFPANAGVGDCGTFVSANGTLYGPDFANHPASATSFGASETPFNPSGSQSFTGSGTTADPYTVTTVVTMSGVSATSVTEVDRYIVGTDFYSTDLTVNDFDGPNVTGTVFHAGDCFLRSFDTGFGALDPSHNSAACTINPNNSPASALEEFVPVSPAGNHFAEEPFGNSSGSIWGDVANQTNFSNNCDCTTNEDNATGISWSLSLTPGQSTTFSWQTKIADPAIAATGGQTFSGRAPLTVNGPVATISDSNTSAVASDYTATVNWGDGTSDQNATITGGNGSFSVADSHTYTAVGSYTITVTVSYVNNQANSAVATDVANVSSPPASVATGPPTITGGSAVAFSGSANPGGSLTTVHFDYGLDPTYFGGGPVVYTASTPDQTIGSDFTTHTFFSTPVSGLVPNALYHVRLVATNSSGTSFGPDVTFMTPPAPPPGSPTIGKTFNISPVSGIVLVKVHGVFIPLTQLSQIPKNTVINALHGTLSLITAAPGGSHPAHDAAAKGKGKATKTQKGRFSGAIFKLSQATGGASKGVATLTIVEGAFKGAPSYSLCKKGGKKKAGDASAAAVSSKVLQLLHASAKGKFKTSGKYSAATVRGTKWTIADRCDGTITHDVTDSVAVTDFVRHKTVILHAGQSYLAKKP
jgi:hypothetical protein